MDDIVNEVNYVEFLVISHPRTVQSSGGGGGGARRERDRIFYDIVSEVLTF